MSPKIELLAPGGDINAIKAAVLAGANAVYCGLNNFNARNRAANLSFEELIGVIRFAHQYQCEIFLTLNIVILESEIRSLMRLLSKLANTKLDGVIVQDLGMLHLLKTYFPTLTVHASTQLTTHNRGQIPFLKRLGVARVNLSRELNLREITAMTAVSREHDIDTEVFVHGSLCVAFSGLCYSTSATDGNSGNRGRCSQACREQYETTATGNNFPLNVKDNSAFFDLPALIKAGVYSFKVEGRIKGAPYVHTVIDSFRKQIDGYVKTGELVEDGERLYKVFNRDLSNGFIKGDLNQSMFIDNPRDHSKTHLTNRLIKDTADTIAVVQIEQAQLNLKAEKAQIQTQVDARVSQISIGKLPLKLTFSGQLGKPLILTVTTQDIVVGQTQLVERVFEIHSRNNLVASDDKAIDESVLEKRFKSLHNEEYDLSALELTELESGLNIPFSELTRMRKQLVLTLAHGQKSVAEVILPKLRSEPKTVAAGDSSAPKLAILINDIADVALLNDTQGDVYFKLPDAYKRGSTEFVELFNQHPRLIPWFPAVLIGKDYDAAVQLLEQTKPSLIVTNNTGIAYRAFELGIKWLAGPFLNTTNSYTLQALKQHFDCHGAFLSNEINYQQMKYIARPAGFKLWYSIYHPIFLMASRQCFFQQTVGCDKPRIDNGCMLSCDKSASMTNLKGERFAIDKQKAGYPSIYYQHPFLNTDIVDELTELFDGFMIDLTNIGAGDKPLLDKRNLIVLFEQLLAGDNRAIAHLQQLLGQTTAQQYQKGL
ncbi:DUF3656 domain-containing protein [Shewanella intestini]|uniref:U32 family peptidase n=1 Tax=Shewanella intestini TaxID=2017544 RepID=A0ABS5HYK4_9GAMM|nr:MULTISPECIES: U32 family peptidase [Shewanella]MBR9726862.1 U32 family peptidase [Shewanella intestini]MRG34572.1 U32 family peptidase [Shewanella sp. XMDDZSB0408]